MLLFFANIQFQNFMLPYLHAFRNLTPTI